MYFLISFSSNLDSCPRFFKPLLVCKMIGKLYPCDLFNLLSFLSLSVLATFGFLISERHCVHIQAVYIVDGLLKETDGLP